MHFIIGIIFLLTGLLTTLYNVYDNFSISSYLMGLIALLVGFLSYDFRKEEELLLNYRKSLETCLENQTIIYGTILNLSIRIIDEDTRFIEVKILKEDNKKKLYYLPEYKKYHLYNSVVTGKYGKFSVFGNIIINIDEDDR